MSIWINYKKKLSSDKSANLIYFVDEKFNISILKKYLSNTEFTFISDLLKARELKKQIITFDLSSKKKIVLVSLKKNLTSSEAENLGAKFYKQINNGKNSEYFVNSDTISGKQKNLIGHFLHGLKLKSYQFLKYKSKKETGVISINIIGKNIPSLSDQLKFKSLEEGTFYARDLVSEPGNVLHPDEYAKRLSKLK